MKIERNTRDNNLNLIKQLCNKDLVKIDNFSILNECQKGITGLIKHFELIYKNDNELKEWIKKINDNIEKKQYDVDTTLKAYFQNQEKTPCKAYKFNSLTALDYFTKLSATSLNIISIEIVFNPTTTKSL